jgi:hypothetical protein
VKIREGASCIGEVGDELEMREVRLRKAIVRASMQQVSMPILLTPVTVKFKSWNFAFGSSF